MNSIKILSRHSSLASAVEALNPDLSYNKERATEYIKDIDRGSNGFLKIEGCKQAFVVEVGGKKSIRYVVQCDITILHEFSPFVSCLSDSPFQLAFVYEDSINVSDAFITRKRRASLAKLQKADREANGFSTFFAI